MKKPENPQAFPKVTKLLNSTRRQNDPDYYVESSEGMSLRDYFAGQAVMGFLSSGPGYNNPEAVSRDAYKVADAMLEERPK